MFGKKVREEDGMSKGEYACRRLQQAGRAVTGDRGGRAANALTGAVGLGRIETCDNPDCDHCN